MFTQILDPFGTLFVTWIVSLVPVIALRCRLHSGCADSRMDRCRTVWKQHLDECNVRQVVSTTKFVRNEGAVIRHNMGWTFVLLAYLVLIGIAC